jgi:excisionase family DNA binding protein
LMSGDPLLHHPLVEALLDRLATLVAERVQLAPQQTSPGLLSKRTLAQHLECSTATIDRLCREGKLPYRLVGDSRRFDLDEVRAALEKVKPLVSSAPPSAAKAPPNEVRWGKRRGAG